MYPNASNFRFLSIPLMLMAFPIVPSVSAADSYTFYGYGGSLGGVPMAYDNGKSNTIGGVLKNFY